MLAECWRRGLLSCPSRLLTLDAGANRRWLDYQASSNRFFCLGIPDMLGAQ
jgi:hypothetical protein